jgi:hypothetical protein
MKTGLDRSGSSPEPQRVRLHRGGDDGRSPSPLTGSKCDSYLLIAPEENAGAFSPSFSLGRLSLPWAHSTIRESTAIRPEGADRARGSACAKDAAASTSRGVGTSATARSRNASGKSAAGRRPGGRPNIASPPRPKPGTPKPNARAASGPSPHPRLLRNQRLRRRVVTQPNLFFSSLLRSARLPRAARDLGP